MAKTIVVHSEPLIEIVGEQRGVSGDLTNIAVGAARMRTMLAEVFVGNPNDVKITPLTAVGDDGRAGKILGFLSDNVVDTSAVISVSGRDTGAYEIVDIGEGKKRFDYIDRDDAAFRHVFSAGHPIIQAGSDGIVSNISSATGSAIDRLVGKTDYFVITGIAASRPIDQKCMDAMFETVDRMKAGGAQIVVDGNYRPRLWESEAKTREVMEKLLRKADTVFISFPDDAKAFAATEPAKWGSQDGVAAQLLAMGVKRVVVREGERGATFYEAGKKIKIPAVLIPKDGNSNVVDPTGAGDTFLAATLVAESFGANFPNALMAGSICAGRSVQHPGGVIRDDFVPEVDDVRTRIVEFHKALSATSHTAGGKED
mgnify:CR=1 FL=1